MKFQILDKEGNPETFEPGIKNAPYDWLDQIALIPHPLVAATVEIWRNNPMSREEATYKLVKLLIQSEQGKIEQCVQIAEEFAEPIRSKAPYDPAVVSADLIAKRIRALASNPQESSRNITQEQTVITALVEACRQSNNVLLHILEQNEFCNPTIQLSQSGKSQIQTLIRTTQDALALANALKKGESSQCDPNA